MFDQFVHTHTHTHTPTHTNNGVILVLFLRQHQEFFFYIFRQGEVGSDITVTYVNASIDVFLFLASEL